MQSSNKYANKNPFIAFVYLSIKVCVVQWPFRSTMFRNVDELNWKTCEKYSGFFIVFSIQWRYKQATRFLI